MTGRLAGVVKNLGAGARTRFRLLYGQLRELAGVRADAPTCASMSAQVGRGVLRRLDRARSGFFACVKAGETPGFPKFEAARR